MAEEILFHLLDSKIETKDVVKWLTDDEFENCLSIDLSQTCEKYEFITYFLFYVKRQIASILESGDAKKRNLKGFLPGKTVVSSDVSSSLNQEETFKHFPCNTLSSSSPIYNNKGRGKEKSDKTNLENTSIVVHKETSEWDVSYLQNNCSPISSPYTNILGGLSPIRLENCEITASFSKELSATSTPERSFTATKGSRSGSKYNLCLGDFISPDSNTTKRSGCRKSLGKSQSNEPSKDYTSTRSNASVSESHKATNKRRIKPTRLDLSKGFKENALFDVVEKPILNFEVPETKNTNNMSTDTSLSEERCLIRMERQKSNGNGSAVINFNKNHQKNNVPLKSHVPPLSLSKLITPTKRYVDNAVTLDILADLYSSILENNLVLNPMTEFYNIIYVITTQYYEKNDSQNGQGFYVQNNSDLALTKHNVNSINDTKKTVDVLAENLMDIKINAKECLQDPHKCVYFATQVLQHQKHIFKFLDRGTVKLLRDNIHMSLFQPDLIQYLDEIYNANLTETDNRAKPLNISTLQSNVYFQIDLDNRDKFPSSVAFNCFRRQRDIFYDILKIWENDHLKPGWNFEAHLSGKIKSMLEVHADVVNFSHLACLFTSQLLISCLPVLQQEEPQDDHISSILKDFKNVNRQKLTYLKERLVTPFLQTGPVPLPSFPGVQEFYQHFILHAFNPIFYAHLEDSLINKITELNEFQFVSSDADDNEGSMDDNAKVFFLNTLSSLRVLGKFLGYVVSLPYKSGRSMVDDVIASQVSLRIKKLPPIDLQQHLEKSIRRRKLCLTLPWVIEYLAIMDEGTLQLPYVKNILEIIYLIYRASTVCTAPHQTKFFSPKTSSLFRFLIGWLFEIPTFPKELYYECQKKYNSDQLKLIYERILPSKNYSKSMWIQSHSSPPSEKCALHLDKLDIVDVEILYTCCPFLKEIKILLSYGNSHFNTNHSVKHITPVSSQLNNSIKNDRKENLELQLEESFFNGHPASTRKTVNFVAERVASCCIKYICSNILAIERKKNIDAIHQILNQDVLDDVSRTENLLKIHQIKKLVETASKNFKEKCDESIPTLCKNRINQALESLLPEDCLPKVKIMCTQIAFRTAMEKINQWVNSHVFTESPFLKDIEYELSKVSKSADEEVITEYCHDPITASPNQIISEIRNMILELLENKSCNLTRENLNVFFDKVYSSVTKRSDVKMSSRVTILSLSIDFSFLLMIYSCDIFSEAVQEKVLKTWKIYPTKFLTKEFLLTKVLSPRNIMLMEECENGNVWIVCGKFLKKLITYDIFTFDIFCGQALELLTQERPLDTSKKISKCLFEAIDSFTNSGASFENIKLLLQKS